MLRLIAKKHVKEILRLLESNDEMYFSEIKKALELNPRNLTDLLNELYESKLINKRIDEDNVKLSKVYYRITYEGKLILDVYEMLEDLEGKTNFVALIKYQNEKLFEKIQKFEEGDIISARATIGPNSAILDFRLVEKDGEKTLEVSDFSKGLAEELFVYGNDRIITVYEILKKIGTVENLYPTK
ncbi:MarR family transcriptional regulator [Methanococcus maripaludis]|uniref:DNA-binding HxlR family transcriptional regulator n=2 Tax=Methanococcus maripaludis TaxID=39152 RepID=A0A7J9PH91_METMI|nr:MarR family transcriptional regulator [Methanococcus maripaludis]MBA2862050.1 DNA-binding HxlR family transcriptional regulator [Methanococcus maripaludis]